MHIRPAVRNAWSACSPETGLQAGKNNDERDQAEQSIIPRIESRRSRQPAPIEYRIY
jgi:hypothetical protein